MPAYYNGDYRYQQYHHDYHEYQGSPLDSSSCSSESNSSIQFRSPWCVCLVVCVVVAVVGMALGLPLALNQRIPPQTPEERLMVVHRLLKQTPLIDGHNDLPWNIRKFVHNKLRRLNLSAIAKQEPWSRSRWSHTDIPR